MYTEIRFTLNGEQKLYQGDPLRRLLDVLREDYGLTGSKEGCGEGECGACSIIKNGELALKGLNRGTFENILLKNLRRRLAPAGDFRLRKAQSTIYIEPENPAADLDEACDRVSRVFGISAFSTL